MPEPWLRMSCGRKHTEGGQRSAGGRNGRGGGPSSRGKHAAAMGSDPGVGRARERARGAGAVGRHLEHRNKCPYERIFTCVKREGGEREVVESRRPT